MCIPDRVRVYHQCAQEIEKKLGSQDKAVVDAAKAVKALCNSLFEGY